VGIRTETTQPQLEPSTASFLFCLPQLPKVFSASAWEIHSSCTSSFANPRGAGYSNHVTRRCALFQGSWRSALENQAMAPSKFPPLISYGSRNVANPSVPRDLGLACFSIQPFPHSHTVFSTVRRKGSFRVLLTLLLLVSDTEYRMARYSAFSRASRGGAISRRRDPLPASGTFVADSADRFFSNRTSSSAGSTNTFAGKFLTNIWCA